MSDFFLGEIRLFPFNWAPRGWALCNGAVMQAKQNAALFSLLGKNYGGDGVTTFQLPDFRGRTGYGQNINQKPGVPNYAVGNTAGAETVAITTQTMPAHTHPEYANTTVSATPVNVNKGGAIYAQVQLGTNIYAPPSATLQSLNPATLSSIGGGQGHNNMQPFAVLNYCIATTGIYPPRN